MNNYITAKEFTRLWFYFIEQKIKTQDKWKHWYNHDSKTWTNKIIGKPISEEENSPIGDFIKTKTELRYRKEDGLFDLDFAPEGNFEGIMSLHEKESDRELLFQDVFYPTEYSVLLEHENNIYHCPEEMAKLTYARARLKVLVTYNENIDEKSDYAYINRVVKQNFEKIIAQSNQNYPENNKTEYLLLIGQLINNNDIRWYDWIFDIRGTCKSL